MRLSARDLACTRGGRNVFTGLNFTADAGEMVTITGPNGSGKSSLLRLVAGLLRPSRGEFTLEGGERDASLGEQAHYLGHQDPVKASLTVAENLAFWSAILGGEGTGASSLASVGLESLAHVPALYLSAGQRRRLSLARLIATHRPIWLLDEPTSALDASAQRMLIDMMQTHLAQGGIILAAIHASLGLEASHSLHLGRRDERCEGEAL